MRILASIKVTPIGTSSSSLSKYVAEVVEVLRRRNLKYAISPFNTSVELDSLTQLVELVEEVKERLKEMGVPRVGIDISLDLRFDKETTLEHKVNSVVQKLK
ncbi:MAG: MTH1187 family thiamine-binding protein [Desulfurococcaceae archaeon]